MKINNFFISLTLYIILMFIGFNTAISSFSSVYLSLDLNTHHYFLGVSIFKNILILLLIFAFFYFLNRVFKRSVDTLNNDDKLFKIILLIPLTIILIKTIVFVMSSKVVAISDAYWIQEAVSQFKHGNYSSFVSGGYIEKYTNQAGFFFISYLLSFVFGDFNYLYFQIINCICITVSYYLISIITKKIGCSNFVSLTSVIIGSIFFPFLMYSTFVYGNIIGLMFSLIGIYNSIQYITTNKNKYLIFTILSSAFAVCVKQNYLINAIAICVMVIFSKIRIRKKCYFVITLIIAIFLFNLIPMEFIRLKTGLPFNQGTPSTAHIAMGLQEGDRAPGWYNGYNTSVYEENNYQRDLSSEESTKEIKSRIQYFIEHKGYATSFFLRKLSSEWNDPSFESLTINQNMMNWTLVKNHNIEKLYRNEFYIPIMNFLNSLQFAVYFGTMLYIISLVLNKERDVTKMIFLIIFAGGFIFHIFWEAKSQYTITYFVLLISLAAQGFNWVTSTIINRQFQVDKNAVRTSLIIIVIIAMTFVIMDKKYMLTAITSDGEAYYEYVGNAYKEESSQK